MKVICPVSSVACDILAGVVATGAVLANVPSVEYELYVLNAVPSDKTALKQNTELFAAVLSYNAKSHLPSWPEEIAFVELVKLFCSSYVCGWMVSVLCVGSLPFAVKFDPSVGVVLSLYAMDVVVSTSVHDAGVPPDGLAQVPPPLSTNCNLKF